MIALYILVELPLRPWNSWLFPKVWLLLALLLYTGWPFLRRIRIRPALATAGIVIAASVGDAFLQWRSYRTEPEVVSQHVLAEAGAIFSSAAALSPAQIVYESMSEDRFVLRASGSAGSRTLKFEGHALHPSVPRAGEPIYFELLAGGHSHISMIRDSSQTLESVAGADLDGIEPAISPDGTKLAFVSRGSLVVLDGGVRSVLAGGEASGEVSGPAFFPDSRRIAFAEGPPGNRSIRSAAATGDEPQTLVEGGDCFEPAISPDGSTLAFSCSGSGGSQLWLLDLKTGIRRQINHGACNNTFPAWIPIPVR